MTPKLMGENSSFDQISGNTAHNFEMVESTTGVDSTFLVYNYSTELLNL